MNPPKFEEVAENERMTPLHYLSVRNDGLSFYQCVMEAVTCVELIEQVDRLFGTNLMSRGTPIERMVDDATGRNTADMQTFVRFVWNYIFLRVPRISDKP